MTDPTPVATTTTVVADPEGGLVRRTVLPSGLRILTEHIPSARSVSVGIWVGVGSRDESPDLSGASHFLEHLLFKGTQRRSALDISAQIEAVGGETNAFTGKEYTCYYARVLDSDLPLAIDVVCDLVTGSRLDHDDVEVERGVILEEIAMHEDEPSDDVHDVAVEALYGDHPLGRRIAGSIDTVTAMPASSLRDFYTRWYTPGSCVVAAAGRLDHDRVVEHVAAAFARVERFASVGRPTPMRPTGPALAVRTGQTVVRTKDTEQAHLVLAAPGLSRTDDRRFVLSVLNNVLGAGMSSRLFQQVRERRGLAYAIYSYTTRYADTGVMGVYAGCAPAKIHEVLEVVQSEVAAVAGGALRDDEVERGRGMLRGALVLDLEDVGARMTRLGKGELAFGTFLGVDEILARVEAVTADQVHHMAAEVLSGPWTLAVLGPLAEGSALLGPSNPQL